ncbi:MAG: hypothetical protein MRJ96_03470 [Nitrospirales bacterium]|nr:hypothetical protein [Nitrospira sp.]MDR4500498.1 hypothetical protein [Nitrospirales bacterium]
MKLTSTVFSELLDDSIQRLNNAMSELEKIIKRMQKLDERPASPPRSPARSCYDPSDSSSQRLLH